MLPPSQIESSQFQHPSSTLFRLRAANADFWISGDGPTRTPMGKLSEIRVWKASANEQVNMSGNMSNEF